MSPRQSKRTDGTESQPKLPRRRVLAIGAGVGATFLAGCAGGTDPTAGTSTDVGEFRLLISDRPADIGDFDRLDVTFSDARIFRAGTDETTAPMTTQESTTTTQNETTAATQNDTTTTTQSDTTTTTQTETSTTAANETTTAAEPTEVTGSEEENGGGNAGYDMVDLAGKTVDLTQVIGEDATPVFDGELEAGEYAKIELNVADVAGVVDGEDVEVKVPSEKLMITDNFEVTPGDQVEFVFDINVVKRGPKNGYNLTPVISGSGVAGRDVEYREVAQNGTTQGA